MSQNSKREAGHTPSWLPIETAPKDGTRVRVKHDLATYGLNTATGVFDAAAGRWVCSQAFIDPHTMQMHFQPTHWMPLPEPPKAEAH